MTNIGLKHVGKYVDKIAPLNVDGYFSNFVNEEGQLVFKDYIFKHCSEFNESGISKVVFLNDSWNYYHVDIGFLLNDNQVGELQQPILIDKYIYSTRKYFLGVLNVDGSLLNNSFFKSKISLKDDMYSIIHFQDGTGNVLTPDLKLLYPENLTKIESLNEYFYTIDENILYNYKNEIVLKDYKKLNVHEIEFCDVFIFQLIDNTYRIFINGEEFYSEETIIDVKVTDTEYNLLVFQIVFANNTIKYLHCDLFDIYETLEEVEVIELKEEIKKTTTKPRQKYCPQWVNKLFKF